MSAGNFNRLVTLQTLTVTAHAAGGTRTPVWTTTQTFMASVEPMTGYRLLEYSQVINGKGYMVKTYYMAGLTTLTERARLVLDDSTNLAIHSIVNVGMKNQWLEIVCDDGK